ncbi:MAG TPA: serine protease [Chroococcales cyanobacterium]
MPALTTDQAAGNTISAQAQTYAGALAHIIAKQNDKQTVIGQAWLAAPNRMITCGHVVQPYLNDAARIAVRFPATGNEYAIDAIQLHPQFQKEVDGLVKFDVALLSLRLKDPELSARPLPLCFDAPLKAQQLLWTIRYLAHLDSPPDPLSQRGQFLAIRHKNDRYHFLHDLALSAGDSGAPLFIEEGVVGLHCGDTASLPGLNLPTTAIRLGLAADALSDLRLTGRSLMLEVERRIPPGMQTVIFLLTAAFTVVLLLSGAICLRLCLH